MIQTETHCHTKNTSLCSSLPAKELVHRYKEAGYGAIIVTDHYYARYWESRRLKRKKWDRQIEMYLSGYRAAKAEGEKIGLKVFLGMEIMFDSLRPSEFLVYGITEDFLRSHPYLNRMDIADFYELIKKEGGIMFQAHPYRYEKRPVEPIVYDGIEVVNTCPFHNSHNGRAVAFAAEHGIKMISGSDAHLPRDVGLGGVLIPESINSGVEFAGYFRENQPELIITFENEVRKDRDEPVY